MAKMSGFATWLSDFLFQISGVMKTYTESKAYFEEMEMKGVFLHGEGEKLDLTAPVSIEFRDVSFGYEEGQENYAKGKGRLVVQPPF